MKQVKINTQYTIPEESLDRFARYMLPRIQAFYNSEEGQQAYREWLAAKEEKERDEQKRKQRCSPEL